MPVPVFSLVEDKRGWRVVCEYDGVMGSARVFAKGEQDARDRAEAQARQKAAERDGAA